MPFYRPDFTCSRKIKWPEFRSVNMVAAAFFTFHFAFSLIVSLQQYLCRLIVWMFCFCFCFMITCVLFSFSFSLWLHKLWVNFYLSFKRGSAVIGCDSAKAQHTISDCAIQKIYNMCSSGDPFTHLMDRLFTTTSQTHAHAHVIIEKKDVNVRCGVCFDCVWMVVHLVTSECMSWATNACLPARPPAWMIVHCTGFGF